MNEGDLSASFSQSYSHSPFLGGNEAHNHVSNILHDNSGIGNLKVRGKQEKQTNPFL